MKLLPSVRQAIQSGSLLFYAMWSASKKVSFNTKSHFKISFTVKDEKLKTKAILGCDKNAFDSLIVTSRHSYTGGTGVLLCFEEILLVNCILL